MTTAALYLRVSRPEQEADGSSLDTQQAGCRAYAAERDYQVIGVYQDVHTGSQYRERPGLTDLRERVRSGQVEAVICYAIDRLSRNQAHLYVVAEEIEDAGARLEFVTEDFEDSAVGRFIRSARAFAAEVEREKIAERTTRGRKAAIAAGKPHPGPYPLYGYQWADEERTRLVTDPLTAPIVRRIYQEYLSGATLRGLAQSLYSDGIPSPQGADIWHPNAIGRLLRHPNYTGNAYGWLGKAREHRNHYDLENAIALPAGTVEPLVSQSEWEDVQRRMVSNRQRASRNQHEPEATLLRGGFARCAVCERAMGVDRDVRGSYRYRCTSGHRLKADRCNTSIAASILDAAVWQRITALFTHPEVVMQEIDGQHDNRSFEIDRQRIERRIRQLETRQSRVAQAIGLVTDPDAVAPLAAQLTQLAAARRELEAELLAVTTEQRSGNDLREQVATFGAWRDQIEALFPEIGYIQKRAVLDLFQVAVEVYPHRHEPRYVINARIDLERFVSPNSSTAYHKQVIRLRWPADLAAD